MMTLYLPFLRIQELTRQSSKLTVVHVLLSEQGALFSRSHNCISNGVLFASIKRSTAEAIQEAIWGCAIAKGRSNAVEELPSEENTVVDLLSVLGKQSGTTLIHAGLALENTATYHMLGDCNEVLIASKILQSLKYV